MFKSKAYESDLAYIHDQGFGDFARGSAPSLLSLLNQAGIKDGRIVDLGCGSGIWARELVNAGFQVVGVDISPAMIEIAQQRVPEAEFHIESFLQFCIPPCGAVTALGEVFNYLFDADNSLRSLQDSCTRIFDVLPSGGLLIFDVAEPGRNRGLKQSFSSRAEELIDGILVRINVLYRLCRYCNRYSPWICDRARPTAKAPWHFVK